MSYEFVEDVSIADVAFRAEGKNLEEVFRACAEAVTHTMIKDLRTIELSTTKRVSLSSESLEMLLFNFLQELIYYKDAERLLFGQFKIFIKQEKEKFSLDADLTGEELDPEKHELIADVKAVTMHLFSLTLKEGKWSAFIVLDV